MNLINNVTNNSLEYSKENRVTGYLVDRKMKIVNFEKIAFEANSMWEQLRNVGSRTALLVSSSSGYICYMLFIYSNKVDPALWGTLLNYQSFGHWVIKNIPWNNQSGSVWDYILSYSHIMYMSLVHRVACFLWQRKDCNILLRQKKEI